MVLRLFLTLVRPTIFFPISLEFPNASQQPIEILSLALHRTKAFQLLAINEWVFGRSKGAGKEWWANRFICRGLFSFSFSWAAFSIYVHENCACDLLAIFILAIYSLFAKWEIQDNKRTGWKRNWHVHFTKPTFSRLFIKQTTASLLRWKSIIALTAFQEPCLWCAETSKRTDRNKRSSISIHQSIFFWLVYFKVKRMWLYCESLIKFYPCNEFTEKKPHTIRKANTVMWSLSDWNVPNDCVLMYY